MEKIRVGISACLLGENVCSGMVAVNDNHTRAEIISLTNKAVLPILPRTDAGYGCARLFLEKPVCSTQVGSIEHFFRRFYERKL